MNESPPGSQFQEGQAVVGTPYVVRSLLGSGGMGSVYEVEHVELGKAFVLKVLHGHLSSRPDLVARMRNEWRALARLNHPHIVQVSDAGQTEQGLPFFVMERLQGQTLGHLLAERGKLAFRAIGEIVAQVLDALHAAHGAGAIHRDVKPHNIFLMLDGSAKLLDFGIAKLRDQAAVVVTAGGVSIGTPRYMAPEQAEGTQVDGRADIYATALVLYEAVVGRGPFAHIRDPNDLVMAHIGEEPERADYVTADVSPELGDLLQRWLSKLPASRPATAAIAARELRALLAATPCVENTEEAASVTLGGAFDASTVGAPRDSWRPSTPSAPPERDPGSLTQAGLAATEAGPEAGAATETYPQQSVKKRTLGWGTKVTEDTQASKGPRPTSRSKTPPPSTSDGRRSPEARSRWLLVLGTAGVSFVFAWLGVQLVVGGFSPAEDEPVSEQAADAPEPALSRRVEKASEKASDALHEKAAKTADPESEKNVGVMKPPEDRSEPESARPTEAESDAATPTPAGRSLEKGGSLPSSPTPAPASPRLPKAKPAPRPGTAPKADLPDSGLW